MHWLIHTRADTQLTLVTCRGFWKPLRQKELNLSMLALAANDRLALAKEMAAGRHGARSQGCGPQTDPVKNGMK